MTADRAEAERVAYVVLDNLEYEQSINDSDPGARNVDRVADALIAYGDARRDAERERWSRRFPIMGGPSVPWFAMAPFERQARENHSQSLKRLAERGGLYTGEAWCVVNGLRGRDQPADAERLWNEWADKVNGLPSRSPESGE